MGGGFFVYLRVSKIPEPQVYNYLHYFIHFSLYTHEPLTPRRHLSHTRLSTVGVPENFEIHSPPPKSSQFVNKATLASLEYLRNNVMRKYIEKL